MRARGPCSTRSNAATRLHMHRRLQAGIDVALQSLPSRAKIDEQGTVVTSRRMPRCAGQDVLPQACGRLWLGSNVPETPSAAGVARRIPCAADIHVTVVRLLLFAPSSIPRCRV